MTSAPVSLVVPLYQLAKCIVAPVTGYTLALTDDVGLLILNFVILQPLD